MFRWNVYNYEESLVAQGQYNSWARALGGIKVSSHVARLIVEFVANDYLHVRASDQTYHVKREVIG